MVYVAAACGVLELMDMRATILKWKTPPIQRKNHGKQNLLYDCTWIHLQWWLIFIGTFRHRIGLRLDFICLSHYPINLPLTQNSYKYALEEIVSETPKG